MCENNKETKLICISKCPELDCDNLTHCIDTLEGIRNKEERGFDYCPCGNKDEWEELDSSAIR
ncbi:hypothetical protein D3C81_1190470 [compost metagenome]